MDEYKPNSHRSKEEAVKASDKKIEKVATEKAKVKKKSEASKIKDAFIVEDLQSIKSYVVRDILVPAVKKTISDIVTNGVDLILYGEAGRSTKRSSSPNISYRQFYDRRDDRRDYIPRSLNDPGYTDVHRRTKPEVEAILSQMQDIIDAYGVASVADFCEEAKISGHYTDGKYGWTSVRNAEIVPVRDGYVLKMPKAMPIK